MASTESEIRALLESQSAAMRARNIDGLMTLYSADIVYFDTVTPLRYAGSAALRKRFVEWFEGWKSSIDMEIRDLRVAASGDVAFAYWLSRATGTLQNGREVASWVRVTSCCQRSDHRWLIMHEHVSWPVDSKSGSAAKDLQP